MTISNAFILQYILNLEDFSHPFHTRNLNTCTNIAIIIISNHLKVIKTFCSKIRAILSYGHLLSQGAWIRDVLLYYVFLPRIVFQLQRLMESWNNHHLRTENGWTPEKLWIRGLCFADQSILNQPSMDEDYRV